VVLDGQDRPHLAYTSLDDNAVKYAYWDGDGWIRIPIQDYAYHSSLALGSDGHPHVAYVWSGDLYHATY